MLFETRSAGLSGLDVHLITVETDISDGLPQLIMIGNLSSSLRESGSKVRTVLKNCGYKMPPKKIVINLSPGDLHKTGTGYDLAIAVSLLGALGFVDSSMVQDALIIGELGLSGRILPVKGILPIALEALCKGIKTLIVPFENATEAGLTGKLNVIAVSRIDEVINALKDPSSFTKNDHICFSDIKTKKIPDYLDVKGQEDIKRAILVAACGLHNILLIGPPGSGKSMIAKRIPGIFPDLDLDESVRISSIYSIKGLLNKDEPLITQRPFRTVHHTVTGSALIGGGVYPTPGEISLANGGVLFLDELTEFPANIIELLRQPLEDREIVINRNSGSYRFPAGFMLVAAANPCPCGYYPDITRCKCTQAQIDNYQKKLSGPFLDRIDMCSNVNDVRFEDLKESVKPSLSSAEMKSIVERVHCIQHERYKDMPVKFNSYLDPENINRYCCLGDAQLRLMEKAFKKMNLSVRGYHKLLKVSRTIADIDGKEMIGSQHILEALKYRFTSGNERNDQ